MTPFLLFGIAVLALLASLYKDRQIERKDAGVVRGLRIHHFLQFAVAVGACYAAWQSDRDSSELRSASVRAQAAIAASTHSAAIMDQVFLELLPTANAVKSYIAHKAALHSKEIPDLPNFQWTRIASPDLVQERDRGLKALAELQRIARLVLTEQMTYGTAYPSALTEWANQTLLLKEDDLPELFSNSQKATNYGRLLGNAVKVTAESANAAFTRIQQ